MQRPVLNREAEGPMEKEMQEEGREKKRKAEDVPCFSPGGESFTLGISIEALVWKL